MQNKSVFELGVAEKVKILTAMMNQMLTFAGVRDELDTRMENIFETRAELKAACAEENKRLAELEKERIKKNPEPSAQSVELWTHSQGLLAWNKQWGEIHPRFK